jgi:hypothetical protein
MLHVGATEEEEEEEEIKHSLQKRKGHKYE